jgi:eukaryotic-like serine/threonine-protein kinase
VVGTPETSAEATLRPPSTSGSSETLPGSAIGTPAYMSPEQAAGELHRLGPASEVYSLGATLYHLLTGKTPFEKAEAGDLLERVQRGDFPPPRQFQPEVPRSLEAVCLKAMARLPVDRYADCRALADDIERWLADEPVSAYREPLPARVARWGRRHRSSVATAVAILVTATVGLAAGLVAVSAEKNRTELARQGENRQRLRAEAGEKEAHEKERVAREKEEEARAVLTFVQHKILAAARPERKAGGLAHDVTLRKALEEALPQIESSFQGRPLVEASVRMTLGTSFLYLGDAATAAQQHQIARNRYTARLGADHADTLASISNLTIAPVLAVQGSQSRLYAAPYLSNGNGSLLSQLCAHVLPGRRG